MLFSNPTPLRPCPAMPSFTSLLSFPGLVSVNFDPCMFKQSYLTSGARHCFSSHRWAFLGLLQMALALNIARKMPFTLLGVF